METPNNLTPQYKLLQQKKHNNALDLYPLKNLHCLIHYLKIKRQVNCQEGVFLFFFFPQSCRISQGIQSTGRLGNSWLPRQACLGKVFLLLVFDAAWGKAGCMGLDPARSSFCEQFWGLTSAAWLWVQTRPLSPNTAPPKIIPQQGSWASEKRLNGPLFVWVSRLFSPSSSRSREWRTKPFPECR